LGILEEKGNRGRGPLIRFVENIAKGWSRRAFLGGRHSRARRGSQGGEEGRGKGDYQGSFLGSKVGGREKHQLLFERLKRGGWFSERLWVKKRLCPRGEGNYLRTEKAVCGKGGGKALSFKNGWLGKGISDEKVGANRRVLPTFKRGGGKKGGSRGEAPVLLKGGGGVAGRRRLREGKVEH